MALFLVSFETLATPWVMVTPELVKSERVPARTWGWDAPPGWSAVASNTSVASGAIWIFFSSRYVIHVVIDTQCIFECITHIYIYIYIHMFVDVSRSRPTSDEMKDVRLGVFAKHRIEFDGFSHLHIPWIPGCGAKISIVGPGPMTGRSHSWLASGILCVRSFTRSQHPQPTQKSERNPNLVFINQY